MSRSTGTRNPTIRTLILAAFLILLMPIAGAKLQAQDAQIRLGLSDADRKVISSHVLTMAEMRKMAAFYTKLAELAKHDRKYCSLTKQDLQELNTKLDKQESMSIAESVKALEGEAATRNALRESGLSAEEYVVIMLTQLMTMVDNVTRFTGRSPFADPVKVHPANLEFLMTHGEELGRLYEPIADICS
jgi:hypothetical protein